MVRVRLKHKAWIRRGKVFPLKNLGTIGQKLSRGNLLLRNNPTGPVGLKKFKSSEGMQERYEYIYILGWNQHTK